MADPLFSMYRGDDHGLRLNLKTPSGDPIPIVGWRFIVSLKLHTELPDEDATVYIDTGELEGPKAESGVLEFIMPAEQTKDLLPTTYQFDIQRIVDGLSSTLVRGEVEVVADVTRNAYGNDIEEPTP